MKQCLKNNYVLKWFGKMKSIANYAWEGCENVPNKNDFALDVVLNNKEQNNYEFEGCKNVEHQRLCIGGA